MLNFTRVTFQSTLTFRNLSVVIFVGQTWLFKPVVLSSEILPLNATHCQLLYAIPKLNI